MQSSVIHKQLNESNCINFVYISQALFGDRLNGMEYIICIYLNNYLKKKEYFILFYSYVFEKIKNIEFYKFIRVFSCNILV